MESGLLPWWQKADRSSQNPSPTPTHGALPYRNIPQEARPSPEALFEADVS